MNEAYGRAYACVKARLGRAPAAKPKTGFRWIPNEGAPTSLFAYHPYYPTIRVGGWLDDYCRTVVLPRPYFDVRWMVEATREGMQHEWTHRILDDVGLICANHYPELAACTPRWYQTPGTTAARQTVITGKPTICIHPPAEESDHGR